MQKAISVTLKKLLKQPYFTAAEARGFGVSSSRLAYYVNKGEIERISRGVYRGNASLRQEVPFEWEDLISTLHSIPKGRICLISALALYDLTDEIPRQFWIAIPNQQFAPKRPKTKIIRMRDVKTGSTCIQVNGIGIRTFSKERTIVDSFRYLPTEVAIKALKKYLSDNPDLITLRKYSQKFRVSIEKYVEAFTL